MRKIVSLLHMSLDGMIAGPQGELDWVNIDDQNFKFVEGFIDQGDTGLYGPRTFRMMEAHWPTVLNQPGASGHNLHHAQWYSKATKVVCSRSLTRLDNEQATLIADPAHGLAALKRREGKNIILLGSPGLVRSLLTLGLLDELVSTLNPVVLGQGIPLFSQQLHRAPLKLESSTQLKDGVVGLHYLIR